MNKRKDKPIFIRLLNTVSAFTLIGATIYLFFAGISLIPSLVLLVAIGGLSGPVVAGGTEGVLDCFVSIIESFFEGLIGVFETIGELFGSIFG